MKEECLDFWLFIIKMKISFLNGGNHKWYDDKIWILENVIKL